MSTEVDPKEEPKKIKPKDGLKSSESVTMDLKPVDVNNPDEIVSSNVSKANAILEHIMKEMVAGNFSPRMAEVASLIINNVNVSTATIYAHRYNMANLNLKERQLDLKEREFAKISTKNPSDDPKSQNAIIITDRETVLKYLRSEKEPKMLEGNIIDVEEEET